MFNQRYYASFLDKFSIVAVTDARGVIIYANDKFCEISKYSREELIGKNHNIINSGYHDKEFFVDMWKKITKGLLWRGEICNKAKDGGLYWVDSFIVPELDSNSRPLRYYSFRIDITERKLQEQKIQEKNQKLTEIAFIQSHEVRRPVANILGLVSLIDKRNLDRSNLEIVEHLEKSTRDLDEVIHKIVERTYENS
ncbi:MAG: PAS domain S-box protein [Thermonemataceae bacterium]|nr:PAS domain S-box protein [Thermonemataceae bacterium]